jgi:hypothetical protein
MVRVGEPEEGSATTGAPVSGHFASDPERRRQLGNYGALHPMEELGDG